MMDRLTAFARRAYARHDPAHGIDHAMKVYDNARIITLAEGIKMTSQEECEFPYVMIGHDFLDHKAMVAGLCLPAETVREFYVTELCRDQANKIMHIHENCSWSKRNNSVSLPADQDWMRKVLQDADWIEAINLQRCINYTEFTFPDASPEQVREMVTAHIHEKLLKIAPALNYDISRIIVERRNLEDPLRKYAGEKIN